MPVELEIVKPAFGGDGIAYLDGKVCFVPDVLPGERVLAEVTGDKKNFLRAKAVKILRASEHRISPDCPYTAYCGGCQYQHVAYPEELRLKEAVLAEALGELKSFGDFILEPIVASDKDRGYRNSVTLHPMVLKNKTASLGYIGRDNLSKVAVEKCLIADPGLSAVFSWKFPAKREFDRITFKLSEKGEIVSDQDELYYRVRVGGESILANSKGFFQNNLAIASRLASAVEAWVAEIQPKIFFDLYAGVGTFSFLSARQVPKVIAVEENPANLEALRMNREEKKFSALHLVPGRVEKIFPELWERDGGGDSLIFVDPPRQGLAPSLCDFFSRDQKIRHLIYVSCEPSTLVRDLKKILAGGRLKLRCIRPFDMFPRTMHVETACLLSAE